MLILQKSYIIFYQEIDFLGQCTNMMFGYFEFSVSIDVYEVP